MPKVTLQKYGDEHFLIPFEADQELLRYVQNGQQVDCTITKPVNEKFRRKFFTLLHCAFDHWDPEPPAKTWRGEPIHPAKDFDEFRHGVMIKAGHYRVVFNADGEMRLRAKSLKWSEMEDVEFERVYQDCLTHIVHTYFHDNQTLFEQILLNYA